MRIAVYPGSFNPWHDGHDDVLKKALKVFDIVIVAVGDNPNKTDGPNRYEIEDNLNTEYENLISTGRIIVKQMNGMLVDFVKEMDAHAVIRGLRNGNDLQYEMNQQYWNEDLGLEVPITYFITDRKLAHVSSSAIRLISKIKRGK